MVLFEVVIMVISVPFDWALGTSYYYNYLPVGAVMQQEITAICGFKGREVINMFIFKNDLTLN